MGKQEKERNQGNGRGMNTPAKTEAVTLVVAGASSYDGEGNGRSGTLEVARPCATYKTPVLTDPSIATSGITFDQLGIMHTGDPSEGAHFDILVACGVLGILEEFLGLGELV